MTPITQTVRDHIRYYGPQKTHSTGALWISWVSVTPVFPINGDLTAFLAFQVTIYGRDSVDNQLQVTVYGRQK